jgi:bifunctional DNase/RNase
MPIDSRPSDAIALALRTGSPIFVNSDVIDKAKNTDMTRDAGESERIRKWLDSLDPDDLGKYQM